MYRVTRLNPVSWAKAFTLTWLVIACIIGLIFVLPFAVFGGLAALTSEDLRPMALAIPFTLVGGLVGLVLAAVMVFVIALVQGAAFSWALGRTGGLEVDLHLGPNYQPATTATPTPVAAAAAVSVIAPPPSETVVLPPPTPDPAPTEWPAEEAVAAEPSPPDPAPMAWPAEDPVAAEPRPPADEGDQPGGPA